MLAASLLGLLAPHPAAAQPESAREHASFGTLTLGARISLPTGRSVLNGDWSPRPGFNALAETPLSFGPPALDGLLQLGLHATPFESDAPSLPDFLALRVTLGWTRPVRLTRRLSVAAGGQFGNAYLLFDDDRIDPALKNESEMTAGWNAAARLRLGPRWSIRAGARREILFTARRVRQAYLSAGLHRTFATPARLRAFLR